MNRVALLSIALGISCLFLSSPAESIALQAQDEVPTIQLDVNKILIPVVVRNKSGRIVDDLKQEDFQVFDEDKPHAISSMTVEKHASAPASEPSTQGSNQPSAPDTPATRPAPSPQRFIVLLFDDLHLSNENLAQAKAAAVKVLSDVLVDRDIGAVISLSQKTNSGLTRDRKRLQDAIMSLQSHSIYKSDAMQCPNIGYYQADLIVNKHDNEAFQEAVSEVFSCEPGLDPTRDRMVAENEATSASRRVLALGHQDAQATYDSIAAFVRPMANLPGERIMILVSPGFLRIEQDSLASESRLMNLAAKSDVTISALDARGLYITAITASEKSPALTGGSLQKNADYLSSTQRQAEDPLAELANATGGTFFHNNNDLGEGLKNLAKVPEIVYVLELSADGVKQDGSYHSLKIKVTRDGMKIQARRGYSMPKQGKNKK